MRHTLPHASSARRAFTILELLVAAAITAVIAGFIVTIVSNVGGVWTRTSGRLSTEAQARLVLDQLSLDLSSARFQDDGNVWLAASVVTSGNGPSTLWDTRNTTPAALRPATAVGTSLAYGATNISNATFLQTGTWLRFFTTKRGSNDDRNPTTGQTDVTKLALNTSAPVAVGWQIIRRASSTSAINTDRRYFLHRSEVRGTTDANSRPGVLTSGYSITSAPYTTGGTNNNGATTGDPRSIQVPGSTTNVDAIVGENVIDFGVFLYVRDLTTGVLTKVFPVSAADVTHLASNPPRIGTLQTQFPEIVDVMVRILDDEGARLIAGYEAAPQRVTLPVTNPPTTPQQYWWQLALAHSQVFTRRIVINAQPL